MKFIAGEWDYYQFQVDYSTPITEGKSGIRVSLDYLNSDSWYRNVKQDTASVFLAYTNYFNDRVKFEMNTEYFYADYTENPGINRPTQNLIDNNIYLAGLSSLSVDEFGVPDEAGAGNGNTFLHPDSARERRIEGNETLLAPQDGADASVYNIQFITTVELNPETKLVNRTIYEFVDFTKHSSYYFYSSMPEGHTLESRFELLKDWGGERSRHESVFAVILRYESRLGLVQFFPEYFNSFDLTQDSSTFVTDPIAAGFSSFPNPVRGSDRFFASPAGSYDDGCNGFGGDFTSCFANNSTADSDMFDLGISFNDTWSLSDNLSLNFGGRADFVWVDAVDPLAPPGQTPVSDEVNTEAFAGSVSLIYKPNRRSTYYFSYNRGSAVFGSSQGGGFGFGGANKIGKDTFDNDSDLIEGGAKFSMLDDTLFVGMSGYFQNRFQFGRLGDVFELESKGVEFELLYQPSVEISLGMNFTYAERTIRTSLFQFSRYPQ